MKKIIIILFSILVILIIIVIVLGQFEGKKANGNNLILPTPVELNNAGSVPSTHYQDIKYVEEIRKVSKILSDEQLGLLKEVEEKLPYKSGNLEIAYSDLLGQYFINKKTSQGDSEFNKFLKDNNINDIYVDFNYLFTTKNESIDEAVEKSESDFIMQKGNFILENEKNNVPTKEPGVKNTDLQLLTDLLKILLNSTSETAPPTTTEQPTPTNFPTHTNSSNITLNQVFNEAGSNVGTPPKLLQAVMSIECGRLFGLPAEKIAEYSQPRNGIPASHYCFRNSAGAMGPMQFLSSTWPRYASSVNQFGGYLHKPYVENIRDSVYASALMLKKNSRANDINWTERQIRRTIVCYNAGCSKNRRTFAQLPTQTQNYLVKVFEILGISFDKNYQP